MNKFYIWIIKKLLWLLLKRIIKKQLYNEQWWIDFEDHLNIYSNFDFNELQGDIEKASRKLS